MAQGISFVSSSKLKIWRREAQRIASCRPRYMVSWAIPFSSKATTTNDAVHLYNSRSLTRRNVFLVASIVGVTSITVSLHVRKYRNDMIEQLPLASESLSEPEQDDLTLLALRNGLMGQRGRSVKDELDYIRKWHQDHGFKGGLVLRELDMPLFWVDEPHDADDVTINHDDNQDSNSHSSASNTATFEELVLDPMRLARRECYYLYYELRGNGHLHQEIFCRGTTLWVDVLTCLQTWMVYDDELECKVHFGFRSHANRLLQDLQPLLAKDQRATISISGHSLGGAVAYILAVKLRKRGYNVVRATAFGSPRFCGSQGLQKVNSLLPQDHLRIEDDNDFVAYLPPFGHHVGSKLWFPQHHLPRFVSWTSKHWWADSFWINFRPWEIMASQGKAHRVVPSYVQQLEHVKEDANTPDCPTDNSSNVKLQGSR